MARRGRNTWNRGRRRKRSSGAARVPITPGKEIGSGMGRGRIADPCDIPAIELALHEGNWQDAAARVVALVRALGSDGADVDMGTDDEDRIRLGYGRVARAITNLVASPQFTPSSDFFSNLALRKRVLVDLFGASDLGSLDALLAVVARELERQADCDLNALKRLLLGYSIDSEAEFDLGEYLHEASEVVVDAYVGLLATSVVLTEGGREKRKQLFSMIDSVAKYPIHFESLRFLAQAWFRCSYDDWEGKHDAKAPMNSMFRRALLNEGIGEAPVRKERGRVARPVVLIPLERFTSTHAMYRCYAPAIRQLRQRFRLVAVCEPHRIDEVSEAVFDDVVKFKFTKEDFKKGIRSLVRLEPDIVYYPSIGMSASVIAMANLRLAPIQVMTFGHPATSMCETIDYAVLQEHRLGDPSLLSETILLGRRDSWQMEIHPEAEALEPLIREDPDPVRVSVPSIFFKLNPAFLATCKEIAERADRQVEFHFFPGTIGPRHHHVARRIREMLPCSIVYQNTCYNEYVRNLNRCDVQLAPFPFGGTNSNIDALRQCIPYVTIEGAEVHSRVDAGMLRTIGVPAWLIADTISEYVDAAVRLIDDSSERSAICRSMLNTDLDSLLLDAHGRGVEGDFVNLFGWLYNNHELIVADGRKVWTIDARNTWSAVEVEASGPGSGENAGAIGNLEDRAIVLR